MGDSNVVYSTHHLELAVRKLGMKGRISNGIGWYKCPYHRDDTPSLAINFQKKGFNCFSCKRHGSISSLIFDRTGKSIRSLLDVDSFNTVMYDTDLPEEVKEPPEPSLNVLGTIVPWSLSPEARKYTRYRGISDQDAVYSNMGYMEEGKINGSSWFKRLTIPVYNREGKLINMEGRDTTFSANKKCLYPTGGVKNLYEFWKLDAIKPLYILEGLVKMFVLRSDPFFTNSTTSMGSYLSNKQVEQLMKFQDIVVVKDNDQAGEDFYRRIREFLKNTEKTIRYMELRLPIKDVDEIPTKLHKTVKEVRENGDFHLEEVF